MASTTVFRDTEGAGQFPSRGTFSMAANTLIPKGTIVQRDANGRAVSPSTADASGLPAVGIGEATYNNLTGSEPGGTDDDLEAGVEYGVFGFDISGSDPKPGDSVYVVDNQTVSLDNNGGLRGFAGVVSEVRNSQAFVWMGPHVVGSVSEAATIPATIGMAPAWTDTTTNGLDPATGAFGFNPTVDDQPFIAAIPLPDDLDTSSDVIVQARASISSVATDDDVTTVLVAQIDGGSDVAPADATVLSVALQTIEFTIPAASVPAGAKSLYLEFDCDANLDTADAYLWSLQVKYTRIKASA